MTNLARYNPTRALFHSDFDRFLENFFPNTGHSNGNTTPWRPRVELAETESTFMVTVDLPGIAKEDVTINFENDVLTVSGERTQTRDSENTTYYRSERFYGSFSRSFSFPKGVDVNGIQANFENGVLTITVPKSDDVKPRKIEIA